MLCMLKDEDLKRAEKFCKDEINTYVLYKAISENSKDIQIKNHLLNLSKQELEHYNFWKEIVGHECKPDIKPGFVFKLLYRLFGPIFTLQIIEGNESSTIEDYEDFLNKLDDENQRKILQKIINDEQEHEKQIIYDIKDLRVKYLSYVALGLADAIVEVSGVHAGFLGATDKTLIAGIAGLVVGFSAALSMAGAAYLQAKQEKSVRASYGATVTGFTYLITVFVLALPYLLIRNIIDAFSISLILATAMISSFTYYSSVVHAQHFSKEIIESLLMLFLTAIAGFFFGDIIGKIFGIRALIG
ncbi:putative membrane protein [Caldisphaera lagunensis DSM 15908]|uniref:Putative membrane protein n=2 Tax=Caldisphaera lagunensis TaxID=200415 RepID=L0ABH6_CALLD|nr:putative membrane protein [Caldisphaera lagunensis DSM 15908]